MMAIEMNLAWMCASIRRSSYAVRQMRDIERDERLLIREYILETLE
jgi:hypothetical protein